MVCSWVDADNKALADFLYFYRAREPNIQLANDFLPIGPVDVFKLIFPVAISQSIAEFIYIYADQRNNTSTARISVTGRVHGLRLQRMSCTRAWRFWSS